MSKIRSTTSEDSPDVNGMPFLLFNIKALTMSPSLAGNITFAVWLKNIVPVKKPSFSE